MEGKVEHSLLGKDGPRCEHSSPKKSGFNSAFISSVPNVAFNATISSEDTNNNGSNATNGNETASSKPKSFLEAVSGSAPTVGSGACFTKSPHAEVFVNGKQPGDPSVFHIFPNHEMLTEIKNEKERLRNTAIFFSAVELDKVPARKFLDDWFYNFWNLKLGYQISFCRQIQRGLFVLFFKNPDSQLAVLKKEFWNVGNTTFRALAWSAEANLEEIIALSAPRWVIIKNIPPFLWKFIPQLVEPLGRFLRMDNSSRLVPHLDARILLALKPGNDIPKEVTICIMDEVISCPVETLGGLNACFLCKKEGHLRRECPIIKNKPPQNPKTSDAPSNTPSAPIIIDSTTVIPTSSPPPVVNSHSSPSITKPSPSLQFSSVTSIVDTDGFQTVTKKRKNRSSKNNAPPKEPGCPPSTDNRVVHVQESIKPSTSESLALNSLSMMKPPVKRFQEISDDYYVEVIPANSTRAKNQLSMLENISPLLSESEDIPISKKKGRPPGSKNKGISNKVYSNVDSFNTPSLEDNMELEAPITKNLSQ